MTVIRAKDLAYVRVAAPNLDQAEAFLLAFGLRRAARTADRLYMRGTDALPYQHITELGQPRFIGAAFVAERAADLDVLSRIAGATAVETNNDPAGGRRVGLRDPDGNRIEVVHGLAAAEPIEVESIPINNGADRLRRAGTFYRRPSGPARVKRLGHFVLSSPNVERSVAWYRETLGLIGSDDVWAGAPDHLIASFNRLQRGGEYVDHHVLMVHEAPHTGLNHFGFEVQDLDDVHFGHQHLKSLDRYVHRWGLGRHVLGSQVFNQWADPWGRAHEHWTDSDMLNAETPGALVPASEALRSQWGDPPAAQLMDGPSH